MAAEDYLVDDSDQLDTSDEAGDDPNLSGTLSQLSGALTELTNPSTTAEAQKLARQFIADYQKPDQEEANVEGRLKQNSEQTRQILRAARERVAQRKYDKRNMWLAAAAGFGSPTKTGAFGESASNVAKAVLPFREKEQQFKIGQEDELSAYDRAIGSVDDQELARRMQILMANRKARADLAKEAFKTLGKRVPGAGSAQNSLDRAYSKEYVDFIQNGASDAQRGIDELTQALKTLRSGKDNLTGPVVGAMSTLPLIGKPLQDILNPQSANTQELVESTVQRSLRPILGPQFTEKEGERLISRVYNPRLEEEINAQRLERLLQQATRAFEQKKAAAAYYEKNGTLSGYRGKTSWKADDFMPDDTWPGGASFHPTATHAKPKGDEGLAPEPLQFEDIQSGKVHRKRKFRWPWQFAEGGEVGDEGGSGERKIVVMDDGVPVEVDASIPDDVAKAQYNASGGLDVATTGLESVVGGGLGALAAKYGYRTAARATDILPGRGIKPGEKKVLDLLDFTDQSPEDLSQRLRNLQRRRVPGTMLDVAGPEVRGLAEAAMLPKATETGPMLNELQTRQKDTRNRVADQVNEALKPDPYMAQMRKLEGDRKKNSKPLYDAAFSQFNAIPARGIISDVLDTKEGKRAVRQAIKHWQTEYKGKPFGKADATGMTSSYPLEFLDLVKYYYDDEVSSALSKGRPKYADLVKESRDKFRSELDNLTGGDASPYRKARNQYEADSRILDALKYGHEEYMKASPEEAANYVKNLDFTGKDALRSGVAETLLRQLQGPYTDSNPAQKISGSPDTMERLSALFDNPRDFELFKEALEAEREMFDQTRGTLNSGKASRGSYTPPQGLAKRALGETPPALGFVSPSYWLLKRAAKEQKIEPKEADQILSILKTRDPAQIEKLLSSKFRRSSKRRKASGKAGMIGAAIGAIAPWVRDSLESDDESAESMPDDEAVEQEGVGRGLTPAQIKAAQRPAYKKGGFVSLKRKYLNA